MSTAIKIEKLYKEYKLGVIGRGTLYRDLQSWWALRKGKEDPNSLIGSSNSQKIKNHLALKEINLEIEEGQVLGIIGSNGAGKSTLLKILSRVTSPTKGQILLKGRVASLLEVGTGFHPELTAIANIYQSSILLGFDKKEISTHVDAIIKFAELEKFADTKIKNFSQGMLMRLAFSTAVQVNPDILLLDEVVAVGDMNFQKKCFATIQDFKKRGKSIVLVSHSINDIESVCDRAIFLNKGNMVKIGPTKEVVSEYQNFMKSQK